MCFGGRIERGTGPNPKFTFAPSKSQNEQVLPAPPHVSLQNEKDFGMKGPIFCYELWTGRSGTPSRQSRGVDPRVQIRRGERAQRRGAGKPQCSSRGRPGFRGTLWVASRVPSALSTSNS